MKPHQRRHTHYSPPATILHPTAKTLAAVVPEVLMNNVDRNHQMGCDLSWVYAADK